MSEAVPSIGALTDRVELKRKIVTAEDEGGAAAVFSPIATVWARVRQLTARQALDGDARGTSITHSVVLRFRLDLHPGDRIAYRGRELEVAATNDLNGGRAYLACQCSERVVTA